MEVVNSYDTPVTLRQLFYRLVSEQLIANTQNNYKRLSDLTAEGRRRGTFPALIDRGREIHRYQTWTSPQQALEDAAKTYRRNRTEGQDWAIYIGVEKNGIVAQLSNWFGDLGVPILALGGFSSQSYVDEIHDEVIEDGRKSVLLYAGDFDASGMAIGEDFIRRSRCWDEVLRVALTPRQILDYNLPVNPGKVGDSNNKAFIQQYGTLVQVEVDALDPTVLRDLYVQALAGYWDTSAYDEVKALERAEREQLLALRLE